MTRDFDIVIIGGGPAGLCAAINASSEGLKTLLIDSKYGFGGQAKDSSLIENYPGFPDGVSGRELTATFVRQAQRFGTELQCPMKAINLVQDGSRRIVTTDEGESYAAKAVVLASGLSYRRLQAKNVPEFLGRGVFYGAPATDFDREKRHYCVVGGANSAGQAAVHLATVHPEADVRMLVRGESLNASMSHYLIEKIDRYQNIETLYNTEVEEAQGGSVLERLLVKTKGEQQAIDADALYVFIGASPKTFWLQGIIERDERGFILTGADVPAEERKAMPYETSLPGVFAAGDVRRDSNKRVIAAAGEGSMAVHYIHRYLPTINNH